jgi:hypothetical protein
MIYMALHSCHWFVDMRVTWQIGVTAINALGGAVCDDQGECYRTMGFRLEGRLPADSVEKVGFEFHAKKVRA